MGESGDDEAATKQNTRIGDEGRRFFFIVRGWGKEGGSTRGKIVLLVLDLMWWSGEEVVGFGMGWVQQGYPGFEMVLGLLIFCEC